jgi:hypothetical protein
MSVSAINMELLLPKGPVDSLGPEFGGVFGAALLIAGSCRSADLERKDHKVSLNKAENLGSIFQTYVLTEVPILENTEFDALLLRRRDLGRLAFAGVLRLGRATPFFGRNILGRGSGLDTNGSQGQG